MRGQFLYGLAKLAKKRLVTLSCLSAGNMSVTIERVFMEFDIRLFFENLSRNSIWWQKCI